MADMAAKGRSASGDRHSSVLYPERCPRGDQNGMRLHPESVLRGERNARAFERGVHGRHLLLGPGEARCQGVESHLGDRRHGHRLERLARPIERVGDDSETDRSRVGLAFREQVPGDLRRLAETERQEATGEGIERSEVSDLGPTEARLERTDGAG